MQAALSEAKSIEPTIEAAHMQLRASSEEAAGAVRHAAEIQTAAQARTEELLLLVRRASDQAEAAMRLPQQTIQAAGDKAAALADLSQRISTVIKQLKTAEGRATSEHIALEAANLSADQTLKQLRSHAARVGQLVGIIRQLYGTMDARVESIRERLDSADELCKDVPREIQSIRDAFAPRKNNADHRGTPANGPKQIPRRPDVAPLPLAKGSLGELAQRNQKLNAWLREIVAESEIALAAKEEAAPANVTADRLGQPIARTS
jgi:chromosome segregation ATPase